MQYFSANTSSGRIHCHFENLTDDNIETFGDWNIANTEFHVVRVADGDELTNETKWWDFAANTVMDKTEISLTYSHPHTEADFFSNRTFPDIIDPESGLPATIGRVDVPEETTQVVFNDYDIIETAANTSVTISDIPTDDTYIWVNCQSVNTAPSITVTCPSVVEIDSPKYYRKDIDIRIS